MIWTTVSSRSCFSSVYRASPSLAAKNIINLISVMTIWWCPCIEFSLVLLEECVCCYQCVPSTILSKVLEVLHPQWAFTHTHYQSGQYPGRLESRSEACSALSLNPKQDYLFNFPNRQHWALKSRWCHLRVRIAGLSQQLGWVCHRSLGIRKSCGRCVLPPGLGCLRLCKPGSREFSCLFQLYNSAAETSGLSCRARGFVSLPQGVKWLLFKGQSKRCRDKIRSSVFRDTFQREQAFRCDPEDKNLSLCILQHPSSPRPRAWATVGCVCCCCHLLDCRGSAAYPSVSCIEGICKLQAWIIALVLMDIAFSTAAIASIYWAPTKGQHYA